MTAGGVFGRIDAGYTAVEAQKSAGSLHAHSQFFVQCLHQHTPLQEIMERLRKQHRGVIDGYLNYSAHVSRTAYEEVGEALERRLELKEQEWPEYKQATAMIDCPRYLRSNASGNCAATTKSGAVDDGEQWLKEHLADVQCLQEYKQHHVHPVNPKTEQREPLAAC